MERKRPAAPLRPIPGTPAPEPAPEPEPEPDRRETEKPAKKSPGRPRKQS